MNQYDVLVLGGGMSGSLMALALKKREPSLKIKIIERSEVFHKKVGESTSDLTALYFKSEGLQHILDRQLHKTGLRFWFDENKTGKLDQHQEFSSPSYKSIINGNQFNRATLDQDLLDECKKFGIEILRPATIQDITFAPFAGEVKVTFNNVQEILKGTWLIDCSGRARLIGKKLNWGEDFTAHNTASTWAHYKNLLPMKNWDVRPSKILDKLTISPRYNVTGHFLRKGLWWWHIPLNDDTVSFGVVYDKNIHSGTNPRVLFQELIDNDPRLKELTSSAEMGQLYHYPHLPYCPKKLYGKGSLVIGDAAGFVDPLFSPGMEMTCQQVSWLTPLLLEYFRTQMFNARVFDKYEKIFVKSFQDRLYTYVDKFNCFSSYDVFSCWTQMDFVGYYFFHVMPSAFFSNQLKRPVMLKGPLKWVYSLFKKRYLSIVARRETEGRISTSMGSEITYSGAAVPGFPKVLWIARRILFNWIRNYAKLEWTELTRKVATIRPQKHLKDS